MTIQTSGECGSCRVGYPYSNQYFQEHVHAYAGSVAQYRVTAKGGVHLLILTPPDTRGVHGLRATASEMLPADRAALVDDLAKMIPADVAERMVSMYDVKQCSMPSTLEALKAAEDEAQNAPGASE